MRMTLGNVKYIKIFWQQQFFVSFGSNNTPDASLYVNVHTLNHLWYNNHVFDTLQTLIGALAIVEPVQTKMPDSGEFASSFIPQGIPEKNTLLTVKLLWIKKG